MHIYAFGSICRGDVAPGSDVDLLALVDKFDPNFSHEVYSTYSYRRIEELWRMGNPFAWHLSLESKLIYSSDGDDFMNSLGSPSRYTNWENDSDKFVSLFQDASTSAISNPQSRVFDLSIVFLSIRNIATCYSLTQGEKPDFSRSSALGLGKSSIPIAMSAYRILERSRLLCTRGYGQAITEQEAASAMLCFDESQEWMNQLLERSEENARI